MAFPGISVATGKEKIYLVTAGNLEERERAPFGII
jgi:hypothetical protein